jgi:2-polyprenyl-3-methyl-5-hydroxy-6-metoxy-1,4-benzoquinol methylase
VPEILEERNCHLLVVGMHGFAIATLDKRREIVVNSLMRAFKLARRLFLKRGLIYTADHLFTTIIERALGPIGYKVPGRKKELMYWEKQIIGVGEFSDRMAKRLDPSTQKELFPLELLPFFNKWQEDLNPVRRLKVLDVGSGPISLLSWGHNSGLLDLVSTDVLADEYKELLEIYGHESAIGNIRTVQCSGEKLDSYLDPESFEVIYCNNALDHTTSPRKCLENMTLLVRPRGYIIISGRSREGSFEGWDNVHQHDLFIEDNTLYRSGKDGFRAPLTKDLPLETYYSNAPQGFHDRMEIILRKTTGDKGQSLRTSEHSCVE